MDQRGSREILSSRESTFSCRVIICGRRRFPELGQWSRLILFNTFLSRVLSLPSIDSRGLVLRPLSLHTPRDTKTEKKKTDGSVRRSIDSSFPIVSSFSSWASSIWPTKASDY